MADFCTLCGYADLDLKFLYDEFIKPSVGGCPDLQDKHFLYVNVGGICEHCGLVGFGVNNKFEVFGAYAALNEGEEREHKIGWIDKETFEFIIDENDPKYLEQRAAMKFEVECLEKEMKRRTTLEGFLNLDDPEIKQLWMKWDKGDGSEVGLCEILLYQIIKEHKEANGDFYDRDYDEINLRYGQTKK